MFTRSKTESAAAADLAPQARRDASDAPSIISAGVTIKGNLVSPGDIQLDGVLEGDIRCAALTIGESGRVKGTICADTLIARGEIVGTVFSNTVRLDKSARVQGDLTQRSIAIEAGAKITGHIIHKDKPLETQTASAAAAKPSAKPSAGEASAVTPPGVSDAKPKSMAQI